MKFSQKYMRSGALRHRVVLERLASTPDGGGGENHDFEEVAPFWVAIHPKSGEEDQAAGQLASRVSHEITLRYSDLPRPAMRFRKGERVFHILALIDVDERHQWMRAFCEERYL